MSSEHGQVLERAKGYLCDSQAGGGTFEMCSISETDDHSGSQLPMLEPNTLETEAYQEILI